MSSTDVVETAPHPFENSLDADESTYRFVGIGASAGGLEALSHLVKNLPKLTNSVYVVAQHMSPTHKSMLSSLIARETELPVVDLNEETEPQPDTIYITPPNSDVIYEDGRLCLRDPTGHVATPKPSADRLFHSLAQQCGSSCVGIVLSGTGSDGSYGVQSIREAGGITIAQVPKSAKYDGMPTSAIATGCVDLTLSPDQIGIHLEKILARPRNFDALKAFANQPNPLGTLLGILLARTSVDFSDYKENTLNRRISRRMTALSIDGYETYVDFCRSNPDEVDALHRDLLISVTRFFRDADQFEKLSVELANSVSKRRSGPFRIWVIGCATGEEAYSIAVSIAEILGGISALAEHNVQIFATDIDQNAIEIARKGVYPIASAQDIPARYLKDYFIVGENELTVRPQLRSAILFSHHNVFQDPPFINVDLVSIRNVMIYFNLALQERVLSRVYYALANSGLLFLGPSETVGEMSVFFDSRDGADKIFGKRRGVTRELSIDPGARAYSASTGSLSTTSAVKAVQDSIAHADMALAKVVAPNGLVCTRNGGIIEVIGDISPFVEIRAGVSTALSIKMLRDPLKAEAMSLISVAIKNQERRDGRWHTMTLPVGNRVQLQAFPFANQQGGEVQCLVAINTKFEEATPLQWSDTSDVEQRAYVQRMEHEIVATREALQQTIEELQTANEELQSANEELQSTNEEFQATNEELETSNEELQSTNEELLTVNEELLVSSTERLALASELEATMASAPYAMALVDEALMVRRVSNVGLAMFGLDKFTPSGVHLSQCHLAPGFPALTPLANSVWRERKERRVSVLSRGHYFAVLISPVYDAREQLIGLSITITPQDAEPLAQVLEMVGHVSHVGYWTYNLDTKTLVWSPAMFEIFGRDPSGTAPSWEDAINLQHPEDRAAESKNIEALIKDGGTFTAERRVFGADGRIFTIKSSVARMDDSDGHGAQLIGVVWDTSKGTEATHRIAQLDALLGAQGIGFFSVDVENNRPMWTPKTFEILGVDPIIEKPSVERLVEAFDDPDRADVTARFQAALEAGSAFDVRGLLCKGPFAGKRCHVTGHVWQRPNGYVSHIFGHVQVLQDGGQA